ncbi:hypothetical protein C8J56DRAFT_1055087 [Mycena floridula]|nr:hypothetical protein C8J56DRAFT_1055087 [Mycena floridula]
MTALCALHFQTAFAHHSQARGIELRLLSGMQLGKLRIDGIFSETVFQSLHIPLVRELEISMNEAQVGSWLPTFIVGHSDLTKITLEDDCTRRNFQLSAPSIPFICPFLEAVTANGLKDVILRKFTIGRPRSCEVQSGPQFDGTSLFPRLTELALDIDAVEVFHIDEFISLLSSLRYLKTLSIPRFLEYIDFDGTDPLVLPT